MFHSMLGGGGMMVTEENAICVERSDALIIRASGVGHVGNRMFVYLFAQRLLHELPGAVLTGTAIPAWNIFPPKLDLQRPKLLVEGHRPNLPALLHLARSGLVRGIDTSALACRTELLPPLGFARQLFPDPDLQVPLFGRETLVINIRLPQYEIDRHPGMPPLPLAFYADLIERTGLDPVFMGQLGRDEYSEALRARFSKAHFMPSLGPMEDFAVIRRAKNIVCALSTFSWLAAWLSDADAVHVPMTGLFHPQLRPDINLLPVEDPRYHFYDLGTAAWGASPQDMQRVVDGDDAGEVVDTRKLAARLHGIRWPDGAAQGAS